MSILNPYVHARHPALLQVLRYTHGLPLTRGIRRYLVRTLEKRLALSSLTQQLRYSSLS